MMDPSDSSNNVYRRNNVKIFNICRDVFFLGMKATQSMKKAINALCAVLSRVNVAIAQVPPN